MTFTGTVNGGLRLHGFIGTFNFGGSKADILLGTYGNGQTGQTSAYDWLSAYFGTGADSSYSMLYWSWTYIYGAKP